MESQSLIDLLQIIDEFMPTDSNNAILQKYKTQELARAVFNSGFVKGFTAGIKEGKELQQMQMNSQGQ